MEAALEAVKEGVVMAGSMMISGVEDVAPSSTMEHWQERVARLEHEVSLLRRQLAEIRGGTFAAPADMEASAVESPPPAPEALPAVEALAAPVPAPQVAVTQPTPQPVPQPVPVLAPHEPDWVERAVGAAGPPSRADRAAAGTRAL